MNELELENYTLINQSKTISDLKAAINAIRPLVNNQGEAMLPSYQCECIDKIRKLATERDILELPFNLLTRKYGIRQQMIYLVTEL